MEKTVWIGVPEGNPPHWGGSPRRCLVTGTAELATGKECWWVQIRPPLPAVGNAEGLAEAVLAVRYADDEIADIDTHPVPVRVCRVINQPGPSGRFGDGDLVIDFWADAASSREALPTGPDHAAYWRQTLARIRRFVEANGHSRLPAPYFDEEGRLDILVGNIRRHHAGLAGVSPGPFPGIDYAKELDELGGWSWEVDEESWGEG